MSNNLLWKCLINDVKWFQTTAVGAFGPELKNMFATSVNPHLNKISKRYVAYWDFEEAYKNASEGTLIMAEGSKNLDYNIRKRFTDK